MMGRSLGVAAALTLFTGAMAWGYWLWLPDVRPLRQQNLTSTRYVVFYVERMRKKGKRASVDMRWVGLDQISPYLKSAVLVHEDDRFYLHKGVDWDAFYEAFHYNWKKKKFARGASTITQQVARNLFLSPARLTRRKFKEILIARHLERELSKDRILEIYLNIAEWGEGIFGAEAASRAYFNKAAADLTPEEAVALAVALPSPYRWNPGNPPSELTRKKREVLLERLKARGAVIELDEQLDQLLEEVE